MAIAGSLERITANEIQDGAVINDKLGSDISITNAQLAGSIANSKLVNDSVTVNGTSIDLGASETITAGKVLQVVSATKTDTFTTSTADTFVDVTGLSVSITPSATSSKIFIKVDTQCSGTELFFIQLVRGSTAICIGDSDSSNRVECTAGGEFQASNNDKVASMNASFLDSPNTTSATTYKLQLRIYSSGRTATLNRTANDSDSTFTGRGASTITAFEIAG